MKKAFAVLNLFLILALSGCNSSNDDDGGPSENGSSVEAISTGLQTVMSNGVERTYYIKLPEDDSLSLSASSTESLKPLIFAFHGSFASHEAWLGETDRYGFVDEIGNDAIIVMPDALQQSDNNVNWNENYDFLFFEDILAELDRLGLEYDRSRLFVVGHSSGATLTQQIGCFYGDIVRAIATSSGRLTVGSRCTGSIAVIQTNATNDYFGGTVALSLIH